VHRHSRLGILGVPAVFLVLSIVTGPTASADSASPVIAQKPPPGRLLASLPDPRKKFDYFGGSVAVSGKTAVVGSLTAYEDAGAVYIFEEGATGWPTKPTATLRSPGAEQFGYSVAISGNTIVIGAPPTNGNSGTAYIYVKGATRWPTTPTVTLADPGATDQDSFGFSVAVSGTTAIIGAPKDTSPYTTAAYIYVMGGSGWPTTPTATLVDPNGSINDSFGDTVAVSGNTAIVGELAAAYIYTAEDSVWQTTPAAVLSDPSTKKDNEFANSVGVSGTTAIVGAPGAGSAYLYVEGATNWPTTPTVTLVDPSSTSGKKTFGQAVAVSGKTAIVGAPAENCYLYVEGATGWPTKPKATIHKPGGAGSFGTDVAISGSVGLVGADTTKHGSGEAYIFKA
jgi:FG-GAP repeat